MFFAAGDAHLLNCDRNRLGDSTEFVNFREKILYLNN